MEEEYSGGRHARNFELPGKIMDGRITHGIRYLCKIQALVPDQLLGGVDFHPGKIIDDAAAVFHGRASAARNVPPGCPLQICSIVSCA